MSQYQSDNPMWAIVSAINSLRNSIAHELPSQNLTKKLAPVRKLFIYEMKGTKFENSWRSLDDMEGLKTTITFCAGFLQGILDRIKQCKV